MNMVTNCPPFLWHLKWRICVHARKSWRLNLFLCRYIESCRQLLECYTVCPIIHTFCSLCLHLLFAKKKKKSKKVEPVVCSSILKSCLCIIPITFYFSDCFQSWFFFFCGGGGQVYSGNPDGKKKKKMYLLIFFIMSVRKPHISLNCSMRFCDCKFRN